MRDRKSRLLFLKLLPVTFLMAGIMAAVPADAGADVNNAEQIIYMTFRHAIFENLTDSLKSRADKIDTRDVMCIAGKTLDTHVTALRQNGDWLENNLYEEKIIEIAKALNELIVNAKEPIVKDKNISEEAVVQAYLVDLLGETSPLRRAGAYSNHPLSGYKFFLGGSWTHADSGAAEGIVSASMLFRTRFYDSRGNLDKSMLNQPETWFVDLGVDAHFVTNTSFNRVTNYTTIGDTISADEVLLVSVTSSKLSMALISGTPVKFADYGTLGPYVRFEISTQEGSGDIFRRMIAGLRFENRSVYAVREAAAEVGLTVNDAAGSLQSNDIFDWPWNLKRIILNFELPIRGKSNRGLYIKFHGEWPIGSKDEIFNSASGKNEDISPPLYQFQFGALFDPLDLFGPLFGLGK